MEGDRNVLRGRFYRRSQQRPKGRTIRTPRQALHGTKTRFASSIAISRPQTPFLKAAIEDVVEGLDCAFSLFEDCEQDPKYVNRISISMRALETLKRQQEDAEAAIASVFKDHNWEVAPRAARLQAGVRPREAIVRWERGRSSPASPRTLTRRRREGVALLPAVQASRQTREFIEPCCGAGYLVGHLKRAGHVLVGAHDLSDDAEVRSATTTFEDGVVFVTNPPWRRDVLHPIILNLSRQAETWLLIDAGCQSHITRQSEPYLPRLGTIVSAASAE